MPHGVDERWRLRIRDAAGNVRGAGMLVCTGQVLTCAHVVGDENSPTAPDTTVVVDFVSVPGTPSVRATVARDGWIPVNNDDGSGDIALLDLVGQVHGPAHARLRRLLGRGRSVHAFGFPAGAEQFGVNATAQLSGKGGPGGEWIQVDSPPDDRRVTNGFSGAAVVDEETQSVIGMVVMEYTRERPTVSWMIPVETICRHLGGLARCVDGPVAVDDTLVTVDRDSRPELGFARRIGRWFSGSAERPVRLVVTGEPGSSASSGLRSMVVLADRELRPTAIEPSADGTVPPVGSVDLALDASGKTVDALSRRITERLGSPAARRGSDAALVVDGVDDAADPQALLRELLHPLAEEGIRLLLGFRRESSPAWGLARSLWPGAEASDDDPEVVRHRLDALAERIAAVAGQEDELLRYREYVAARVADVPEVSARAVALRVRLSAARGDPGDTARLDDAEDAADRTLRRLERHRRVLDELRERRSELRRRLAAYQALAVDRGFAENVELDVHYRRADDALWQRPCDLDEVAGLVRDYRMTIRDLEERG
jgi:hypothetical protein